MAQTIYQLSTGQNISNGLVEIINIYGGNYYVLAIDGQIIDSTYKQGFESAVLKRSFIKKCTKISKVKKNDLIFVYIDWDYFGNEIEQYIGEYDANDYEEDYKIFLTTMSTMNKIIPIKYIKLLAKGVEQLEEKI